jgi:predicted acyltransferase
VFQHVFMHIPDAGWRSFAYAIVYTAVCFIPLWVLYRRKIFLKV